MRRVSDEDCALCDTFRHSWDVTAVTLADVALLCVRCTTLREDTVDRYSGEVKHKYTHSKAYRAYLDKRKNRDGTIPSNGERRLDLMRRLRSQQRQLRAVS